MSKKLPTMSNEVKVALITSAATILAAIISGIFLLHRTALLLVHQMVPQLLNQPHQT